MPLEKNRVRRAGAGSFPLVAFVSLFLEPSAAANARRIAPQAAPNNRR